MVTMRGVVRSVSPFSCPVKKEDFYEMRSVDPYHSITNSFGIHCVLVFPSE
jgi:hypothetical protein